MESTLNGVDLDTLYTQTQVLSRTNPKTPYTEENVVIFYLCSFYLAASVKDCSCHLVRALVPVIKSHGVDGAVLNMLCHSFAIKTPTVP